MKETVLAFLSLSIVISVSAQQDTIQNGGFEEWNFNPQYDDPAHWTTLNPLAGIFGVELAFRATAAGEFHSGSSAIKLVTSDIPGIGVAPSIVTNGMVNTAAQTIEGGVPISSRPTSFGGWYRFDPVNADTGNVSVELTRWDAVNNMRESVGSGSLDFVHTNGQFVNFEFDLFYESSELPDTVLILMSSGTDVAPQEGTALFLDDLYYTYPASIVTPESIGFSLYPNPTVDFLSFRTASNQSFTAGRVMAMDGRTVMNFSVGAAVNQINVKELPAGTYILELQNGNELVVRQTFLKN